MPIAFRRCCAMANCNSTSDLRKPSLSLYSYMNQCNVNLFNTDRLCGRHIQQFKRKQMQTTNIGSATAAAAGTTVALCCFCEGEVNEERPHRPIIEGVIRTAHGACAQREKREVEASNHAVIIAMTIADMVADREKARERRQNSLRSSGKFTINTYVSAYNDHANAVDFLFLSLLLHVPCVSLSP